MDLEITSKLQWYKRLLRRFERIFQSEDIIIQQQNVILNKQNDFAKKQNDFAKKQNDFAQQQSDILQQLQEIKQQLDSLLSYQNSLDAKLYVNYEKLNFYYKSLELLIRNFSIQNKNDQQSELYSFLKDIHLSIPLYDVVQGHLIRVGRKHDGGYVMLDELNSSLTAYSYGISDEISWESQISSYGIHCYMYDHTIDSLPEESPFYHWKKEGICGNTPVEHCNTLVEHIKSHGDENNYSLILKMDVEGAEWDSILSTPKEVLNQFSQIIIELHDVCSIQHHQMVCKFLKKLNETHNAVWLHGNNGGDFCKAGKLVVPSVLEVCYVRKEDHNFIRSNHFYPLLIDMPNGDQRCDITIGVWNDVD